MPALTVHEFGKGKAYYAACRSGGEFYRDFLENVCRQEGVESLSGYVRGLEVTGRSNEKGSYVFLLNHGEELMSFTCQEAVKELLGGEELAEGQQIAVAPKDVKILKIISAGKDEERDGTVDGP